MTTKAEMTYDVYIFGTSHKLQCGVDDRSDSESVTLFEKEIARVLSEHGIERIAEEMSPDGLKRFSVCQTVCQRIAKGRGDIATHHVDLGKTERIGLSLSDGDMAAIAFGDVDCGETDRFVAAFRDLAGSVRERVWVARILSRNEWPVLFVCGSDHTDSVRRLFTCLGVKSTVIHHDFDPNTYSHLYGAPPPS